MGERSSQRRRHPASPPSPYRSTAGRRLPPRDALSGRPYRGRAAPDRRTIEQHGDLRSRRARRRRRRRTTTVLTVLGGLAAVLLSGLAVTALLRGGLGAPESSAPAPQGPPAVNSGNDAAERRAGGIRTMLATMTSGLRSRDEAAYLSVVDGRRAGVLARQRALFRALRALPLSGPQYTWSGTGLTPASASAGAGAVNVVVEFRYRLAGWDRLTAHDPLTLTIAPVGDRWLLVGDTAETEGLPLGRFAEPWASGRLVVEKRNDVLVVGDTPNRGDLRRLAINLERVIKDVRRLWPEPTWNGKVVAYAATDRRFVAEWFDNRAANDRFDDPGGAPSFEARVVGLPGALSGAARQRGPTRLIVTPYLLRQPDSYALPVLRHEVAHVATDHIGRYPPAWLLEGAAEYTGFRVGGARVDAEATFGRHGVPAETAVTMRRGTWRPLLVNEPRSFYRGTSTEVEAAYIDAWIAALYVADRHGEDTLRRLYHVAATQPRTASWDDVSEAALRSVLDTDEATFTEAVRRYGIGLRRHFA